MRPFDIKTVAIPFNKIYRGNFASQFGYDGREFKSIMLAFQHDQKYDPATDCYLVVIAKFENHAMVSAFLVSNGVASNVIFAPSVGFDISEDSHAFRSCFSSLGLQDHIDDIRMLWWLRKYIASDRSAVIALNRALGVTRARRWGDWIRHAARSYANGLNSLLIRGSVGLEPGDGFDIVGDGERKFELATTLGGVTVARIDTDRRVFAKRKISVEECWHIEPNEGGWDDDAAGLYAVRRDADGLVNRVFDISPEFFAKAEVVAMPRGTVVAPTENVVAAMFDDETRRKFRLLRQDVYSAKAISGESPAMLSVVNDDGTAVSIERGRAVALFTE